jgi:hypothetical protein
VIDALTLRAGLLLAIAGLVVAVARRWSPPIWGAVVAGLLFRVAAAVLAAAHTPLDVTEYFQRAGAAVLAGDDPMTQLPRFWWNFLPLMPYWWAFLLKTGLPWGVTVKALPIAADLVNVILVARLAPSLPRVRALQYAANPVAILVTAWHGQVEPIALALGMGALLSARTSRSTLAGTLVGLAASVKTWPVLFAVGALRDAPKRARLAAAAAVVPLLTFLSMPLFFRANLWEDLRIMAGYRSLVGTWGWTAMARFFYADPNSADVLGYTGAVVDRETRIGTVLFVLLAAGAVWLWRRWDGPVLMQAIFLVFLAVTPGFGLQHLMWPMPMLALRPTWRSHVFLALASLYLGLLYVPTPFRAHLPVLFLCLPVIAAAVLALPWELVRSEGRVDEGAPLTEPGAGG